MDQGAQRRIQQHSVGSCSRHSTPLELEWQRNAGVSRFFIRITEVFPGEAVPVPALLAQLRGTGGEWDYFYITS